MISDAHFIAANRFGYGANDRDLQSLNTITPVSWLKQQLLEPYPLPKPAWSSQQAITDVYAFNTFRKGSGLDQGEVSKARRTIVMKARAMAEQSVQQSFSTNRPLQARLLDFFSNHFSVSRANLSSLALAPTLEAEAIAPNLHGYFAQMLKQVVSHPAMIVYLNNERSVGPNSKVARRRKKAGLNENLGREVLELHTLGVNGGYTQQDVIELAKALSGWSIGNPEKDESAGFVFRHNAHEPGRRTILNKRYAQINKSQGEAQGLGILNDLANHPQTAKHISHKLAKHFIADQPDQGLVDAMSAAFLSSQGHIPSVMNAMIDHPQSWQMTQQKLKTPRDFVISACRGCSVMSPRPSIYQLLEVLGQGLFNAGSPAGYADDASAWSGPQALMSRIEWSEHFAKQVSADSLMLAPALLGGFLNEHTRTQIARAESQRQAITLLLMSPEFQRR
ncbi:DUF1800 family protein [Glaciecola sp. SC05]|uniref:DUF1800 domain-containing protein n=1 Tax=Glaciecola sp. SC05 TaxID=1987355 RepID=UPI003527B12E